MLECGPLGSRFSPILFDGPIRRRASLSIPSGGGLFWSVVVDEEVSEGVDWVVVEAVLEG